MNTLFTLKARLFLLVIAISLVGLKVQGSSIKKLDTALTKSSDSTKMLKTSVKMRTDTTLYVRTGSTIVTKADTTFVINTDNRNNKQIGSATAAPAAGGNAPVVTDAAATNAATTTITTPATGTTTATTPAVTTPPVTGSTAATVTDTTSSAKATTDQAKAVTTPVLATDTTAKKDSSIVAKTDSAIAKKDTSMTAKTDTLAKSDSLTNLERRARIAFIEVGGPGLAISANYDARFYNKHNGLGYRVGAGYFGSGGNQVFTVPLQLNYLYGKGDHMLELGIGTTFLNSKGDNLGKTWEFDKITGFIGTGIIGYRYAPANGRLNLRLAFVPILYDEGLLPIGGISVGYTF